MALKTFNLDEDVYKEFSKHCKSQGLSMSKKVENFIKKELETLKSQAQEKPLQKAQNFQRRYLD